VLTVATRVHVSSLGVSRPAGVLLEQHIPDATVIFATVTDPEGNAITLVE
jgi:hypothetical protein